MFFLVIYDERGERYDIGEVKIGREGMRPKFPVGIPESFSELSVQFFSLGQDDSYYSRLGELGVQVRELVLSALRDMAFDENIYSRATHETVTKKSLMRFVKAAAVRDQFRRIAQGGERITGFQVEYETPPQSSGGGKSVVLSFAVAPQSLPPTNIHVLIGRNGVGKSFLLNNLTRCISVQDVSEREVGRLIENGHSGRDAFANIVSVTFSAFDDFPLIRADDLAVESYSYVGLKTQDESPSVKTPGQIKDDFTESVEACLTGERAQRWAKALRTLQYSGSGFIEESWLERFLNTRDSDERRDEAHHLFSGLSSGHKIVLLTMTRLVEHVTERTLVIIDEPESHLHPPLLSAFVRALSDLLTDRNGLVVLATHSPVVLQEVPKSCVWKLRRYGEQMLAERPNMETFGENVGILTHEVFGLEVTDTGFHRYLKRLVRQDLDYREVLLRFSGQLGGEAKAIVQALIAVRDSEGGLGPAAEERY
ncbi:AAA family ATPase [Streptomyces violascens]|uniref:AAA family ATPase n=1 Tax=Streptomyces violascens TaxID=67381 RepID=UPI0036C4A8D9